MVTFQNRAATFLWGFAATWLSMLCAMTYVLLRDGPPADYSVAATIAVSAFFWFGGIGLALFATSKPNYFVVVRSSAGISATWRFPHKVVRRDFPRAQVQRAAVVDATDSDGDPYYFARAAIVDGESIQIAESHARSECEQACLRFNQALFDDPASDAPSSTIR